jgi:ADP-ribose pyrophosphatase
MIKLSEFSKSSNKSESMTIKHWKKLSTTIKHKNDWWNYQIDKYLFPTGKEGEYHYVHTYGSAFIIPILDNGKIILVNQYRYLNDRISLEFPGGGIKEGQNPKGIARKELIEETGFEGDLEKVGIFNPYNGITDEICHVFFARNLKPSDEETKDEFEEFEIVNLSIKEIDEKIRRNEIYDGMTMASWALARSHFL